MFFLPLYAAIRGGYEEIVRWLLTHCADVSSRYGGHYWRGQWIEDVDVVILGLLGNQ